MRIQFSTGTFRSEYENEQGHYALHISYTSKIFSYIYVTSL